jgi:uncharacterized protein (DUF2141 family)
MKDLERLSYYAFAVFGAVLAWMLLAVALVQPARAEEAASLVVHVQDVSPRGGILRLGLYDAARYPDNKAKPVAAADVKAEAGETTVVLRDLPPGEYAIQAYQDVNANDRMDTSWIGLPQEPFGFSRDARPHLSKPRFGAVRFRLTPGENHQTLHLQNSISLLAAN